MLYGIVGNASSLVLDAISIEATQHRIAVIDGRQGNGATSSGKACKCLRDLFHLVAICLSMEHIQVEACALEGSPELQEDIPVRAQRAHAVRVFELGVQPGNDSQVKR